MADAYFEKLQAENPDVPYETLVAAYQETQGGTRRPGVTPQQTVARWMQAHTRVSPSQVNIEENRPIARAGEALERGVTGGLEAMFAPESSMGERLLGIPRLLAAPGEGVGEAFGTTAQNVLGAVPGLGGPSGVVPAAGATAANLYGQFITGAALAKGLGMAGRGIGRLFKAPANKEAVIGELAKESLGQPGNFGERVMQMGQEAKALFQAAEQAGPVPLQGIKRAVSSNLDKAEGMLKPSAELTGKTGLLSSLSERLAVPQRASYGRLMEFEQELGRKARDLLKGANPDSNSAFLLNKTRSEILDAMDQVSPIIKQANARYKLDIVSRDVIEILRGANPGAKLRTALEADPIMANVLNIRTPKALDALVAKADEIGKIADPLSRSQQVISWAKTMGKGAAGYFVARYLWDLAHGSKYGR